MTVHTLVITKSLGNNLSGIKQIRGTFTGSASYDTGGSLLVLSVAPTSYTAKFANTADVLYGSEPSGTYSCVFVPGASNGAALGKVLCIVIATGAEVASTFDLSGTTFSFLAVGADAS